MAIDQRLALPAVHTYHDPGRAASISGVQHRRWSATGTQQQQ